MGSVSDIVMNDINEVEEVLNLKFKDALTATVIGPTNKAILSPPFDTNNIFLDNDVVTIPPSTTTLEYIEFVVNYAGSVKSSQGVYTRIGVATATVFTPLGKGWARSGDIFAVVRKTFQDAMWTGKVLSVTNVDFEKVGKSGGMRQTNIDITFQYFEGK